MLKIRPSSTPLVNTKRILVAEDDEEIRRLLAVKLTCEGFDVLTAPSGQHALDLIAEYGLPHLAIVDINMPIMGGLEFCERVKRFSDVPIIILTAVDESKTIINAIERFAEDYITKPFNLGELIARIHRVLKRIDDFDYALDAIVKVNPYLSIDFSHQTAIVEGEPILLTPTEAKLLHIFLTKAERVVSTQFLLERVWPAEERYEDTLRVHISRLRQKLEGQHKKHQFILTERGRGYRFVLDRLGESPVKRQHNERAHLAFYIGNAMNTNEKGTAVAANTLNGAVTESAEKIERVREIIFGSHLRESTQKFDLLQRELARLQEEVLRLNEQLREQDKVLRKQLRDDSERLTAQMQAQEAQLAQQYQTAEQRQMQQLHDLDQRHTQHAQQLSEQIQRSERALLDELSRLATQLNDAKADRHVLGDWLIGLGNNLKATEPAPLPKVTDVMDQLSEELL